MVRKLACLVVMVCVAGLVSAQTKDKAKTEPAKTTPAKLVSVDAKKGTLTVEMGGAKKDFLVSKDVKFIGPKGGVSKQRLKDDRLTPGASLGLVMEAGKLKEVHLPVRKSAPKEKGKTTAK